MVAKTREADIGDLKRASEARLELDRKAPMSERLARVHFVSKQMSAIKGAAVTR